MALLFWKNRPQFVCLGVDRIPIFQFFRLMCDFLPRKYAACLSHHAEIIIVQRLFHERNNMTRVRVEPRSRDQGCPKNDTFALYATPN